MLRICTSLGFRRTERQQLCIKSWQALGYHVIAVQSEGETKLLQPHYPDVTFVETTRVGDVFNHTNKVRINALLEQAVDSPILIINSDIEIRADKDEFVSNWTPTKDKELKMGIRWDEDPYTKQLTLLKYGIDIFLVTPEIANDLNDIGMTIGCPAWDYWVPIHLQRKGYSFDVSKRQEFIHEVHPKNWSKVDFEVGLSLLRKHYRLDIKSASKFILQITGRENLK